MRIAVVQPDERLALVVRRLGVDAAAAEGRIEVTEQLGSELLADVLVGSTSLMVSRVDPEARLERGQPVGLAFNASRLHFFDPDTGAAIA